MTNRGGKESKTKSCIQPLVKHDSFLSLSLTHTHFHTHLHTHAFNLVGEISRCMSCEPAQSSSNFKSGSHTMNPFGLVPLPSQKRMFPTRPLILFVSRELRLHAYRKVWISHRRLGLWKNASSTIYHDGDIYMYTHTITQSVRKLCQTFIYFVLFLIFYPLDISHSPKT